MTHSIFFKAITFDFLVGTALLTSGCGSGTPSDSDIERALGSGVPNCDIGYVVASNVKKTNGMPDGQSYRVTYSYDLQFVSDSPDYEAIQKSEGQSSMRLLAIGLCNQDLARAGVIDYSKGKPVMPKKGDRVSMTGEMTMIRSEQGWVQQP